MRVMPFRVQTDPSVPLVSTGVQTSPLTTPELIDGEPTNDQEALFFKEIKNDRDDVMVVEAGTLYQAPPKPFPPAVEERFLVMALDEDDDAGRKIRRGQDENDDFTHTRPSTSDGLKRPFSSVGSHRPKTSTPDVASTAVQTYCYPPPRFTTIGTQTDPALLNWNPVFDARVSGVLNHAFPELGMHSLLPATSLVVPIEIVSYESFPDATNNVYLVQLAPRFSYVWLTSEFIDSSYSELVQAFLRSNPNHPGSVSDDSGTASDGNGDDVYNDDEDH